MRTFLYSGLFFALLFSFTATSSAQILPSISPVNITLTPKYPQPGQQVTATVTSNSENVSAATILWVLDDTIEQQEIGGVSFTLDVGDVGTSQTLSVLVRRSNGEIFTAKTIINPSEVTLLWEADTYTPPFYKGRSLFSSGSRVRAEAIVNFISSDGTAYSPEQLNYVWRKDNTVLGSQSGSGSSSLITAGPKFLGEYILSVEVTSPDGMQISRSSVQITTTDPIILLYERDPLTGIQYHNAIGIDHIFTGSSQFQVQASPYYMDAQSENDNALGYSWSINNESVFGLENAPSVLSVQLETDEKIDTTISVNIVHSRHLLQVGEGTFGITFAGSARSSLFGL